MRKYLKFGLPPRNIVWALALTLVGMLLATGAIGQASRGSTSIPQSAGEQQTVPAAAEPILPFCPAARPATQPPSPDKSSHHKVILFWNAGAPPLNSESKTVGYCLYRSDTENVAKQSFVKPNSKCPECDQINSRAIANPGCVDDALGDSKKYYYVVIAIDGQGNTSSSSNEAPAEIPPTQESSSSTPASSYPRCQGTVPSK